MERSQSLVLASRCSADRSKLAAVLVAVSLIGCGSSNSTPGGSSSSKGTGGKGTAGSSAGKGTGGSATSTGGKSGAGTGGTNRGNGNAGADNATGRSGNSAGGSGGMGASGTGGTGVGSCGGSNVCTTDYPCQMLGDSYTCRGQFADWPPAFSASAFTVNHAASPSNNTVTDSRSGLVWQQVVTRKIAWQDAKTNCAAITWLEGTGWRLPSVAELESLVDDTRYMPSIDPKAFPNPATTADFQATIDSFWSSSPVVGADGQVLIVDFTSGATTTAITDPNYTRSARCVRSSALVVAEAGSGGVPPGRYTFPESGAVYDTFTKLTWQQVLGSDSYTLANAKTYCSGLPLAGGGWRLPTRAELLTLEDRMTGGSFLDPMAFPSMPIASGKLLPMFKSSSPALNASDGPSTWVVGNGGTAHNLVGNLDHVRCVR